MQVLVLAEAVEHQWPMRFSTRKSRLVGFPPRLDQQERLLALSPLLPSDLLSNESWVKLAIELHDLNKFDVTSQVSEERKSTADLLVTMLRDRFQEHVKSQIKEKSRRTHWSMKLAYNNLAVNAALMVLSKHIKMDLSCLSETDSLLATNTNNFFQCTQFPNREGAYLYFDRNRGCFVRSGKKTRGGFVSRGDEHNKAAAAEKASSHFYFAYPSSSSSRAMKQGKRGLYEHLEFVIGAGFDPSSDSAKKTRYLQIGKKEDCSY